MADDVIRLSTIGRILRRQWRWLLTFAVLGAAVATAASLVWSPAYESSSRVLLQGDPDKARVLSEAQIAMSLVVLDRAAAGLKWGVDGPGLRGSITAAVIDGNVIEIKAKANSVDKARQLAERVTEQYIAFSTEILTTSANASGEVLAPRKDSLQRQVVDMSRRISELEGSVGLLKAANEQGAAARVELQHLTSDRTEILKELNDLDALISKAQAATGRENFRVIEPPTAPPAAVPPTRLQLIVGGAALAVVLGALVLVVARQSDRRLRRGSDIAAALGAPFLGAVEAPAEAAVRSPPHGSPNGHHTDGRQSLLQRLVHNGTSGDTSQMTTGDQSLEYLRYRRVLALIQGAHDELAIFFVIVFDDDVLASHAVGRLAIEAAVDGRPVLRAVPVAAVRPTVPDAQDVSGIVVVMTSGTRTAEELLAVAEGCHDAGHPVAGVLMVLPGVDEDGYADSAQWRRSDAVGPLGADRGLS